MLNQEEMNNYIRNIQRTTFSTSNSISKSLKSIMKRVDVIVDDDVNKMTEEQNKRTI